MGRGGRARRQTLRRCAALGIGAVLAGTLAWPGCGIAVRTDRAAVGGGPEQATAQAHARLQATVVAAATANASLINAANSQPCDCESTGK